MNVPPGTRPLTFHRLGCGGKHTTCIYWGYEPAWGTKGPASNVKLEKLLENAPFWRGTLERRVIVPADDPMEWLDPATTTNWAKKYCHRLGLSRHFNGGKLPGRWEIANTSWRMQANLSKS